MSKLENNTTSLQTILNTINNLPEAGGGNTEDLEAELSAQETLITNITTALQNKAASGSGGGSVKTCTVTFIPEDLDRISIYYIAFADGRFRLRNEPISSAIGEISCNNVVQNSCIETGDGCELSVDSVDGTSYAHSGTVYIGTSDTTVFITLRDDLGSGDE